MFGYTHEELFECFLKYPLFYRVSLPQLMIFVTSSAFPLLNDQEKNQMDTLKEKYEYLLKELSKTLSDKKKTAHACLDTLYEAVSLYDQSFDRIADSYFENVYN